MRSIPVSYDELGGEALRPCQHLPLETVEIVFRRSAGEANLLLYPDYRHVSDRPGRHRNLLSFPPARADRRARTRPDQAGSRASRTRSLERPGAATQSTLRRSTRE